MWVNETHRRGSTVHAPDPDFGSPCATSDPGAVLDMPKWSWLRLGAAELPLIWPLASAASRDLSRDDWQRTTARWLALPGRGAVAVRTAQGPALAAFLFVVEGPRGSPPCCFIVRLWVVEPGLPGRSLRACLTMARDVARHRRCRSVFLERAAIDPGLDPAHVTQCARSCGYLPCRDGWYAPPAGSEEIVTLPRRRSRV